MSARVAEHGPQGSIRRPLARRLPHFVWLVVVWVGLWADFSIANVLGGALVAAGIMTAFRDAGPRPATAVRPIAALRYVGVFLRMLVQSTALVAVQVLRAPSTLRPAIIAVPMRCVSDAIVTLVGNSITLTPGTMTLDTRRTGEDCVLYVHVLNLTDLQAVLADVRRLEHLAIDAFGNADERAAVRDPLPDGGRDGGPA